MRLIGDIGGTKALLGVVDESFSPEPRLLTMQRLYCADHSNFAQVLTRFLVAADLAAADITGGCLAVAGPLADDGRSAKLTNLPWTIDSEALTRDLGIGPLKLVNDFAAAALGVTQVAAPDRLALQTGEALDEGVRVVIGAGTGLGMAVLVKQAGKWRVLPGEGGHCGFAPADETQAALWAHLNHSHGRVEYEHLVSGPGLVNIYRFLAGANIDQKLLAETDPAATIARRAAENATSTERRALDMFLAVYGAFAGDMALTLMARGGVFIAGGIAAKILPLLQSGTFLRAFTDKGKHSALAARMPVYVVTDAELGLKGAALYDRFP